MLVIINRLLLSVPLLGRVVALWFSFKLLPHLQAAHTSAVVSAGDKAPATDKDLIVALIFARQIVEHLEGALLRRGLSVDPRWLTQNARRRLGLPPETDPPAPDDRP